MSTDNYKNFKWGELLDETVRYKNVIPIIGQGLYWIEKKGSGEVVLYDYLAQQLAKKIGIQLHPKMSHKFAKMAFEFLRKKNNTYENLAEFLYDIVKGETLIAYDANPLSMLAKIKAFNLFINTTYDDLFVSILKKVRDYPIIELNHSLKEDKFSELDDKLYNSLEESQCALVFNIYGNSGKAKENRNMKPAYTERDILEIIVKLHEHMIDAPSDNLILELKRKSLLFIGCGYDDWLFRFFIRTVANEPFNYSVDPEKYIFIGDDLFKRNKDPLDDLPHFLENHYVIGDYSRCGKSFVRTLFKELEKKHPNEIIQVSDFPHTVFISFEGTDREVAKLLASHLEKDGIKVWLDDNEFKPGDKIDKKIKDAIKKCPVFIPLISNESKQTCLKNGKKKYHYQEWDWVVTFNEIQDKKKIIMPISIDGTDWLYDRFENDYYVKIPGGEKKGDYEKLRARLSAVKNRIYYE